MKLKYNTVNYEPGKQQIFGMRKSYLVKEFMSKTFEKYWFLSQLKKYLFSNLKTFKRKLWKQFPGYLTPKAIIIHTQIPKYNLRIRFLQRVKIDCYFMLIQIMREQGWSSAHSGVWLNHATPGMFPAGATSLEKKEEQCIVNNPNSQLFQRNFKNKEKECRSQGRVTTNAVRKVFSGFWV